MKSTRLMLVGGFICVLLGNVYAAQNPVIDFGLADAMPVDRVAANGGGSHLAAYFGKVELIQDIISQANKVRLNEGCARVDLTKKNDQGLTPLEVAIRRAIESYGSNAPYLEIVKLLIIFYLENKIKLPASLYANGNNIAHVAARYGCASIIQDLMAIKSGLLVAKNDKVLTPLELAICRAHELGKLSVYFEIVKSLIKYYADNHIGIPRCVQDDPLTSDFVRSVI